MKFKDLTLEEVAKILDGDSEKGCGVNGLCDDHCPLWCEAKSHICSLLDVTIDECKKYFDMDISYNKKSYDTYEKLMADVRSKYIKSIDAAYKNNNSCYYVISRTTSVRDTTIVQYIAIVENEQVAKHFCSTHSDMSYEEIKYE